MAFMAAVEADLRSLSAEARRRHPAVKDAAEHTILKLRTLSNPGEIAQNEDVLQIVLLACSVKNAKLSIIGLSCLQKLISHDAVPPSALGGMLFMLKNHAEMFDENILLKTLQTILIIFQSCLHPDNEENTARALSICLRLLESNRSSDNVRNTAAATFRQAVALIFDNVVRAESLPSSCVGTSTLISRASSVANDVSRSFSRSISLTIDTSGPLLREVLTEAGRLGLLLLEDLTALAAGGSASWLHFQSLQRAFALDIIEFVLSNYVPIFGTLSPYQKVLRHQICSLLMTSLRTNVELEGEAAEPSFRRLVLRSVAHVIRLYSPILVTESEVFLNMLLKVTRLDLPLWHRILVLEILRGFCVEARILRLLFLTFDMNPANTNVVENMTRALALVISSIQEVSDSSSESLAAVAGMFSSKAKGIEWSMDIDASNAAVLVASEAHAITLAIEGLLGIVFTIATLTDEAVEVGEIESPRNDFPLPEFAGQTSVMCISMVNSTWLTILDALSLILMRSQGEAIILEILKGYQAFTQACGVLHAIEPLNSFLASLCKFTMNIRSEGDKRNVPLSPGSKKIESLSDLQDSVVLTPKNVQALRTLFNVAHRLQNFLGPSWVLVLETLAALDRAIHSPFASTQEISSVSRLTKETSGHYSDFHILSSLNSQLFESSALMNVSAVKSLLLALHQLSTQHVSGSSLLAQQIGTVAFSLEHTKSVLVNNLNRVESIWDQIVCHLQELVNNTNPQIRSIALGALDYSICAVLGSEHFVGITSSRSQDIQIAKDSASGSFECALLSPLVVLYTSNKNFDVRLASLKILVHILERHGEKIFRSWPIILQTLMNVADSSDKDLISLGFQSIRVIMNEGLSTIPVRFLHECVDVTGTYGSQNADLNISLTSIGLLWNATDFIAKSLDKRLHEIDVAATDDPVDVGNELVADVTNEVSQKVRKQNIDFCNKLLLSVFSVLQKLGSDERPEVRNSAIRTLFQTLSSHGQKFSGNMWEYCLSSYIFPILDLVSHLAANSSRDEWQGKELGTRGGKTVHMLIHHSRNTAQKQWDETIVLVLGGISRILRSFFPFLCSLNNFTSGWDRLLNFLKNSILDGSKEIALASVSCLQTVVSSHCPSGSFEASYVKSILDLYEMVVQRSPTYGNNSDDKVKQEILRGLGDLYVQAQSMFDVDMYNRLLNILRSSIATSKSACDAELEMENIPQVLRTVLEIIPLLQPAVHLASMWKPLFHELLPYVNVQDLTLNKFSGTTPKGELQIETNGSSEGIAEELCSFRSGGNFAVITAYAWGNRFLEKLLPLVVELYLGAPNNERCEVSAEVVHGLGRCMSTRRDNPSGPLWRISVECFNRVVKDAITQGIDDNNDVKSCQRLARCHFWKEVADAYDAFLVGCCGRILSSYVPSVDILTSDELIEMNVLCILADNFLKTQTDAPVEILQQLVTTLDRCASRTGSLPLASIGLLPPHCSRFSLSCLQMLFSLCSYNNSERSEALNLVVMEFSISVLMKRCRIILKQFLTDENDLDERVMPTVRIEETIYVLQELARLVIHPEIIPLLPMPSDLKATLKSNDHHQCHAHLCILLPSFCELAASREPRVRELVVVLLRLIAADLGLQHPTE